MLSHFCFNDKSELDWHYRCLSLWHFSRFDLNIPPPPLDPARVIVTAMALADWSEHNKISCTYHRFLITDRSIQHSSSKTSQVKQRAYHWA